MNNENATCSKCGAGIWAMFHSPVNGKYFCSNHFKEENQERSKIAGRLLGKRGGEATKKKLGKEHFKRISKLGVEARKK